MIFYRKDPTAEKKNLSGLTGKLWHKNPSAKLHHPKGLEKGNIDSLNF